MCCSVVRFVTMCCRRRKASSCSVLRWDTMCCRRKKAGRTFLVQRSQCVAIYMYTCRYRYTYLLLCNIHTLTGIHTSCYTTYIQLSHLFRDYHMYIAIYIHTLTDIHTSCYAIYIHLLHLFRDYRGRHIEQNWFQKCEEILLTWEKNLHHTYYHVAESTEDAIWQDWFQKYEKICFTWDFYLDYTCYQVAEITEDVMAKLISRI